MPSYAYRCRTCASSFEVTRSMTESTAVAPICPDGHVDTARVWSAVAVSTGRASTGASPAPQTGGCCGGGCCG